jgi:hypothetical protein
MILEQSARPHELKVVLVVLDSVDHDRDLQGEGAHEMVDGGCRVGARNAGIGAGLSGADGQGLEACRDRVDPDAVAGWNVTYRAH